MLHKEHAGNALLAPKLCVGLSGTDRCGRVRGWSSAEGFRVTLTLLQADPQSPPLSLSEDLFLPVQKGPAWFPLPHCLLHH